MLRAQKKHISFHTPGHKQSGDDITELSYSDSLSSPTGVIARAEEDIASVLGASRSFILTDGSTSGVYAMLYAAKCLGIKSVARSAYTHVSVKNGCALFGLEQVILPAQEEDGIPLQLTKEEIEEGVKSADALLLTSPDYYGNFPDLAWARELCDRYRKLLLIDGAHGSHLHFDENYAGRYADFWVDGVHKSLPAMTQGAVVSCNCGREEALKNAVALFRTSSPSYPIMASVEYAVKYPQNQEMIRLAEECKLRVGAYPNADWSKIVIAFGERCNEAQRKLEEWGIYPEFNDGNYLMFYLSPATGKEELFALEEALSALPRASVTVQTRTKVAHGSRIEYLPLTESVGRVCAEECGLFPPCLPLLTAGELITAQKAERLKNAQYVFGLKDGKIAVYTED